MKPLKAEILLTKEWRYPIKRDILVSIWKKYKYEIKEASKFLDVPEEIILAVIYAESQGYPSAVSPAGAVGLMQIMPKTYVNIYPELKKYGVVDDIFDPRTNIYAGTYYLKQMYSKFKSWEKAIIAYNAGPDDAERGEYEELPEETKLYLVKILGKNGVLETIIDTEITKKA